MVSLVKLDLVDESEPGDLDADFQWINCSHPNNVKTAKNRHTIHQHSMKDVGKSRRKLPKRRKVERVQLDISALESRSQLTGRGVHEMFMRPSRWLGTAAGMDPFIRYPIDLDSAAQELLAAVFQDDGGLQRPLRDAWFAVGLADEAAFLQVLSNSALHLDTMRNGGRRPRESRLSIYYQLRTVISIKKRLANSSTGISDASIGAVAALMVHDDIIGAFDGWANHHKGLKNMIDLRGGIKNIESNEMLRITLSWVELRGAFQQDIQPVFPISPQWWEQLVLPSLPYGELLNSRTLRRIWTQEMPGQPEWLRIYESLVLFSMNSFPAPVGSATLEHPHTGAWSNPTVYRLLIFRPLQHFGVSNQSLIQEACRLGSLLYLALVWRMFGVHPVRSETLVHKLQYLLGTHEIKWSRLWKLQLWALYVGAMEAQLVGDMAWFVKEIAGALHEHGINSWDRGLACIQEVLWVETIFGGKDSSLSREIDGLLQRASRNSYL